MKRSMYILFFLIPVAIYSQQNWYKSSPMDYLWKYLGNPTHFYGIGYLSFAFSPTDGQPYVASCDYSKVVVMTFDGTNWVNVGDEGFSQEEADWTNLAFNPSGQPCIAYCQYVAAVMKYDSVFVGLHSPQQSIFSIYPNPAKNKLRIDLNKTNNQSGRIEITNIQGIQMFETETNRNSIVVNVEKYSPGIYLVKMKTSVSTCTAKFYKTD